MAEDRPRKISAPLPKTPEGRGSSTAFNPMIARNSHGLSLWGDLPNKAHVLNEVANAGGNPVRSTTFSAGSVMACLRGFDHPERACKRDLENKGPKGRWRCHFV